MSAIPVRTSISLEQRDEIGFIDQTEMKRERQPPTVVLVLDASGSMQSISAAMLDSVNSFIDQQKSSLIDGMKFSLIVFSSSAKLEIDSVPIQDVSKITPAQYRCTGTTALWDSIALAIDHHTTRQEVLVVVITDGQENSSTKCTQQQLQNKISAKKEIGWKFIYLANNPEVAEAGTQMGIHSADEKEKFSTTNNVAVGFEMLAPVLRRGLSEAVTAYRTSSQVPNLNNIIRSETAPTK